jgi:hypothetical protein
VVLPALKVTVNTSRGGEGLIDPPAPSLCEYRLPAPEARLTRPPSERASGSTEAAH